MATLCKAAFLCALIFSPVLAHQATYFMPQIPDPDAMVIDGKEDDWGWYDPVFAITPDIMFDVLGGEWPVPREDWNCTLYVAWSSAPDNALYYFARVTDDSLFVETADPNEYWSEDALEVIIDADHSSENFRDTDNASGQQYAHRILPAAGVPATHIHGSESTKWSTQEPYLVFRWTLDPPDAKPLEQPPGTTVTYTYEVRQMVWTFLDQVGADDSIEHQFVEDQVIGLTFQFDEAENGLGNFSRERQPGTTPVDGAFADNSNGSDFITVPTEGATGGTGRTAVEAAQWGRIKARMAR